MKAFLLGVALCVGCSADEPAEHVDRESDAGAQPVADGASDARPDALTADSGHADAAEAIDAQDAAQEPQHEDAGVSEAGPQCSMPMSSELDSGECGLGMKICGDDCVNPNAEHGCGTGCCDPCPAPENAEPSCEYRKCSFRCSEGYELNAAETGCEYAGD